MAFKLFRNDNEYYEEAVDLIKRKEFEKAVSALQKAKSKDKDGDITAKCNAMESVIRLHRHLDDPASYERAAGDLKEYGEGELELGLTVFSTSKLANECLLMARARRCRMMPSGNSAENIEKGNALIECARGFQAIGDENLMIWEFFTGTSTTGMKESLVLMAEGNEALAEGYAWEDPKKAAEYEQYAYNYRRQAGQGGEANIRLVKRYSTSATCWICGRDATGEGMHFFPMSSDISPQMRNGDGLLRSADEGYQNIYVCRACYTSISRRADAISKYYYDQTADDMRAMEARLQSEIAALQAQITALRFTRN